MYFISEPLLSSWKSARSMTGQHFCSRCVFCDAQHFAAVSTNIIFHSDISKPLLPIMCNLGDWHRWFVKMLYLLPEIRDGVDRLGLAITRRTPDELML